ncbi:hypothetical protein [Paenibacillus piri]|uniref:Uncharacterized protein n=1 Tax=Paenibacillus piri TaxID=2547395 RepID=A0A4R5KSU4_9BACL|nr:hypothetical protein [Paenibacillus piri]TDF98128.1 hypothetical protein E1757_11535 [Paenibacillus piri]
MKRWGKWIPFVIAASLLAAGWGMWKTNPDLHFDLLDHPDLANPDRPVSQMPNDGSSFSFKIAHEQRLLEQSAAAGSTHLHNGGGTPTAGESNAVTKR